MIKVKMKLDKVTKGAIRYSEEEALEEQVLRTVYIRKTAFKDAHPEAITVSIEW